MKKDKVLLIFSLGSIILGFILIVLISIYQFNKNDKPSDTNNQSTEVNSSQTQNSEKEPNSSDTASSTPTPIDSDDLTKSDTTNNFDGMADEEIDSYIEEKINKEYGEDYIASLSEEKKNEIKEKQLIKEKSSASDTYADENINDSVLTEDKDSKKQMSSKEALTLKKEILKKVVKNEFSDALYLIDNKSKTYLFTSPSNSYISNMYDDLTVLNNISDSATTESLINLFNSLKCPEIMSIVYFHIPTEAYIKVAKGLTTSVPIVDSYAIASLYDSKVTVSKEKKSEIKANLDEEDHIEVSAYKVNCESIDYIAYFYTEGDNTKDISFYGYEEQNSNTCKKLGYWIEIYSAYDEKRDVNSEILEMYE